MNYAKIITFDIANGNGIRVSLFLTGCKFHCQGCFNEKAQDYSYGKLFTQIEKESIINILAEGGDNYQGLTLIGGDPLWQNEDDLQELIDLCNSVHNLDKDVWIWTGYTWDEIFNDLSSYGLKKQELIKNCDVLVDGRFEIDKKDVTLPWRGSSNQRVINIQESLRSNKIILKEIE